MIKLIISIVICQLAGAIGSLSMSSITTWYAYLRKPAFNPPGWVFGPVWFGLYTLMGISAYLIWRKGLADGKVRQALMIFLVQLALNALWSPVFFGLRSPLAGLVVIIALWIGILMTTIRFFNISKPAALLFVPYILWVSFAAVLNAAIYLLNRP